MADLPQDSLTPLPKSKEVLKALYARCEQCLAYAERVRHRNVRVFELLADFGDGKIPFADATSHAEKIRQNMELDKDDFIPDPTELLQYCDPMFVKQMQDCCDAGRQAVDPNFASRICSGEIDNARAEATMTCFSMCLGMQVSIYKGLKERIGEALDRFEAFKCADTKADMAKILEKSLPKSPHLQNLIRAFERMENSGKPKIAIARDLTGGDETKAQSLLKEIRRYRTKLNAALRERSE